MRKDYLQSMSLLVFVYIIDHISQVSKTNRTTIRTNLVKGTLYKGDTRLVYATDLVKHIPEVGGKTEITLTNDQLDIVKSMKPRT